MNFIVIEMQMHLKTVLTTIQFVCVTKATRCHLGAIRACLGPVGKALLIFFGLEATMTQHEYKLI